MAHVEKGHRWFAANYDRLNASWEREHGAQLRRDLLAGLQGDVLEIGAGSGANFAHYPAEARVLALEPDPYMLARARDRVRPNIDLQQAPAERLPAGDAAFDAVVSTLVLCTVSDLAVALAEVRRVLRPDGNLLFMEHVRATGALGMLMDAVQPVYGWFAAGCQLNRRTEQELIDAGFALDRIERMRARGAPLIYGRARRGGASS